jgi:IS5 family transposase
MHQVKEELMDIDYVDHRRVGKRRYRAIQHSAKESQRKDLYRDLLKVTVKTANRAQTVSEDLKGYQAKSIMEGLLADELSRQLSHYVSLTLRVITQTTNRVMYDQRVESKDKVVSIFEPHTDIIIKSRRETQYGHKLCLSTGRSGMVIDCAVLEGNPSDSNIAVEMIERVKEIYNKYPRQVSFDGGFASRENLNSLKSSGIEDVVFNKKRSLKETEMARSSWIYRSLTRFRAGIESTISFLKRCFGIDRCLWRGLDSFRTYTLGSIVSYNLLIIARHQLKQ